MASYLQFDKPVFVLSTQITVRPVWVNTTSVQSASLKKNARLVGRIGSELHLVGRLSSGPHFVDQLGSGPQLMVG